MEKNNQQINTNGYQKQYSDSAFWRVMRKVGAKVAEPALILFYELKDPNVPIKAKAEIVAALGYLICPIDLIPDGIPVVGYSDDLTALLAAVSMTSEYCSPSVKRQAKAKLRDWFGDCCGAA